MSPKKPKPQFEQFDKIPNGPLTGRTTTFLGRDGLGAYIASPTAFPASRVIYHNEKFVVINDLYPKSSVHLLLIPRDPSKTCLHPFEAFEDSAFLADVLVEVEKIRGLAAKELRRRFGTFSKKDMAREAAMDLEPAPAEHDLPRGRDWDEEVVSGVHAHPSMNHLHIHIISKDRMNECMRHRKHYNSFATPFFVPVEDFPLDPKDKRRHPGHEGYLGSDLVCWKCGMNFRNRFARLKEHLEEEFQVWRSE